MEKKFIVLDSNIKDYSGHFYRYALHCLRAAKKRGYATILATNKAFSIDELTQNTFPTYTYSMEHYSGLLYLMSRITDRAPKPLQAIATTLSSSAIDGALINLLMRRDAHCTATFATETSELFADIQLCEDDVVFLPTSSFVEAFAISDFLRQNPHQAARWSFLFRVQSSYVPSRLYSPAPYYVQLLRTAFTKLLRSSSVRIRFYTDSEHIANDYNLVVPELFKTVPIPHTTPMPLDPTKRSTITVSYVGQARTGKGFYRLPGLIENLWEDYIKKDLIRFVIQSSAVGAFSIDDPPTEKAIARLQKFDPSRVELILDSMSDAAYQKMLFGSDIVLMPYNTQGYLAQTSGICAEALAYGIPVVVPGGCWLARQFARAVYEYHDCFGKSPPLEERTADGLGIGENAWTKTSESTTLFLDDKAPTAEFELLALEATHLRIKTVFGGSNTTPFFQVRVEQKAKDGGILAGCTSVLDTISLPYATCLIPLRRGAASLQVSIRRVVTQTVLDLKDVRIALFDEDPSSPRGAVGMIYGTAESIPDCLRDMVNNYDHYQETARAFSSSYYARHNADSLIDALEI